MNIVFPEFQNFSTKVVFYGIPYNAASSIHNHLGLANVIKQEEEQIQSNLKFKFLPYFCLKPKELEEYAPSISISDYFSFCVVRDPWDRVVSMHKSASSDANNTHLLKGVDFLYFCEVLKDRKNEKDFLFSFDQHDWIDYSKKPPSLLRFESLHDDFSKMAREINLISISPNLPNTTKRKREHYSNYYNSESKKIISEVFERDIDTFKYSFIDQDPDFLTPRGSKGFLRI